ncbi:MAG: PstS family phosphate ABC transporter substrate-binding protein [Runella sp.]
MKIIKILALVSLLIVSCSVPQDSSRFGKVTISADESLKPMLDQIYQAYEATYTETKFNVVYRPEQEAVMMMLQDSARVVFTTRELNEKEKNIFKQQGIRYNPQPIAIDGVALLVNKANTDTLITLKELSNIFKGKLNSWSELQGGNLKQKITLVFDNANSSNLNFIMAKFGITSLEGISVYSAGSNQKVIEYVSNTPHALGFIGVNWISDGDSPLAPKYAQQLKVVGLSEKNNPSKEDFYQPFQRDLGLRNYPLHRKVYAISREMHAGLGSGLVNYIMRDVGSLIIEKCGLWPTKPFNREVIIKKEI